MPRPGGMAPGPSSADLRGPGVTVWAMRAPGTLAGEQSPPGTAASAPPADPARSADVSSTPHGLRARRLGPVTFRRLEVVSFVHSSIYLALLVCAFGLGGPRPETDWLGWAHGLLWIGMSLTCIAAARARIIPFWLAVTVAVLGGLGPFAGSIGFVVADRRRAAAVGALTAGGRGRAAR